MDAFGGLPEDDRDDDEDDPADIDSRDRAAIDKDNHEEVLRLLTVENVEAAMDLFFEAKDPKIDSALKLKLIGLASKVGDNARRAAPRAQPASAGGAEVMSDHKRNTGPMQQAQRCGAVTRAGGTCEAPAVRRAARRRMHGGKASGAPKANRNALRQGLYTKEVLAREAKVRALGRWLRATIKLVDAGKAAQPRIRRRSTRYEK